MSVELSSAWWKSHKAKTLSAEPLTPALAALDKARAVMEASPSRENLALLMGATKVLPSAIAQTEAKCNKTLHKDTLAHLRQMEAMAKAAYPLLQAEQQNFAKLLADYHKLRDLTAGTLEKAVATPNASTLGTADATVKAMLKWMNDIRDKNKFESQEVMLTTQWIGKTQIALKDAVDFAAKHPPDAKLPAVVKEIAAQIPRIKASGGFQMPKGGTISNKPFGQG